VTEASSKTDKEFVLIDYVARVKDTGEVVETTLAEEAKKAGIFDAEKTYEPLLVIVGEGRVVRGLEDALKGIREGEEKEIEIPPEKAYGVRDPRKVKIIPLREFRKAKVDPVPGKIVEIGGALAVVRAVSGGRVQVDFNHPLAGKTLVYKVKVVKRIKDPVEKARALIRRRIKRVPAEKFGVELQGDQIRVRVPEEALLLDDLQYAKLALAKEFADYLGVEKTVFVEEFVVKRREEGRGA